MPQLVREERYFSHMELGVEMGESINLRFELGGLWISRFGKPARQPNVPVPAFDIVVVTACY